ncbi:MAG: hypothetical protein K2X93_13960 [Candidatus Obscuribacterales bacterium]|nr:hypothetical protein [Candidatus Obscuribacterales bacterium]
MVTTYRSHRNEALPLLIVPTKLRRLNLDGFCLAPSVEKQLQLAIPGLTVETATIYGGDACLLGHVGRVLKARSGKCRCLFSRRICPIVNEEAQGDCYNPGDRGWVI